MTLHKPYQAYQNNAVNTASGGELTLMLYNGCLKFIKQATKDILEQKIEAKNTNIQKAQAIIQELIVTLDSNVEIAKQILPLYNYIHQRLMEANIKNDVEILDEVLGLVTEFRDTWKQVILLNRQKQYAQGGHV